MARILTTRTAPRRRPTSSLLVNNNKKQTLQSSVRTASSSSSDLTIKPWTTPIVESHGDYREEAWLEDYIGNGDGKSPLYQYQKKLPALPIPVVADTLARFLPTALPLAKNEQEATALVAAVDTFEAQAEQLQERLLARAATTKDSSWIQHWWNTTGYLQVRAPSVVNVSYFFHLSNDVTAPTCIHRAAAMLTAVADYRLAVATGQLPAEMVGKKQTPLCSTAYKYMLNACRIPAANQDSYRIYDPAVFHHAVVARHGYFFAVPLVEPETGRALPLTVLEGYLEECRERADGMQRQARYGTGSANAPPQLGWLTSMHRDDWARARQVLCQDPATEQALELLESGAVLLCLDDEAPVSRQECGQLFCFGGAVENSDDGDDSNNNNNNKGKMVSQGANRWFDKSIQLFCTNNGKAGLMGEHSMMDGMPVVGLAHRITELTYDKCLSLEANRSDSGGVVADTTGLGQVVSIFENVPRTPQIDALVEQGT
jgi:carnitine O-acetyltransferase